MMIILKVSKRIALHRVPNLNREAFTELIDNNPELKYLSFAKNTVDLIDILDGHANVLKRLEYGCKTKLSDNLPEIRLNSLETLKLKLSTGFSAANDTARLLRSIKCEHLEKLVLENFYWNAFKVVDAVCSF